MSANVEIVKRGIDAFHRLDLDGFAEIATLDIPRSPRSTSRSSRR
jgi:hypothetical protein